MNKQQLRTRVKFCGITRIEDVLQAAALGVDALGFAFFEKSKRYITIEQAQSLVPNVPAMVQRIGVFVNADTDYVAAVLDKVKLTALQFHGDESEAYCQSFALPYIKVIRMQAGVDVKAVSEQYPSASAILLDTFHSQHVGGTGEAFDWQMIPNNLTKPLILAGGLTVGNVAEAVATVQPFALDLSSGIESAPGIKDSTKMQQFIAEVARADRARSDA